MTNSNSAPSADEWGFRRAKVYALIVRISTVTLGIGLFLSTWNEVVKEENNNVLNLITILPLATIVVSTSALIISSLGTASAIMLGWRLERRQAQEFKLKIEQLELELAEARKRVSQATTQP